MTRRSHLPFKIMDTSALACKVLLILIINVISFLYADKIYVANNDGDGSGGAGSPTNKGFVLQIEGAPTSLVMTSITNSNFNLPYGITVSPDGKHVFIANRSGNGSGGAGSGFVSHIDLRFGLPATITSITSSNFNTPTNIAITPDGKYLYVSNMDGNGSGGAGNGFISQINLMTSPPTITSITNVNFADPRSISITPDGNYLYVSNYNDSLSGSYGVNQIDITNPTSPVVTFITNANFNSPLGVDITPNGNYVYVTNQSGNGSGGVGTGFISQIDVTNPASPVITSITNSNFNTLNGIAITSNGNYAYVANRSGDGSGGAGNGFISQINITNPASPTFASIIDSNFNLPTEIAFSINSNYAYVTNEDGDGSGGVGTGFISQINITTPATPIVTSIINTDINTPIGIAITAESSSINAAANINLSVINTAINAVVATIGTGNGTQFIAITPDDNQAYVTNNISNVVNVVNIGTNEVTDIIAVGSSPLFIAITPSGNYAYVTNYGSDTVSVIDTTYNIEVTQITVGTQPYYLAVTPDGAFVCVVNRGDNTVTIINTTDNSIEATISVGTTPYFVAITPNSDYAYVTNFGGSSVSVIDLTPSSPTQFTEIAEIAVGLNPYFVAIKPTDGAYAYVANSGSNTVSAIDTATNTVAALIPLGGYGPRFIAMTPDGNYACVANSRSGNVSVISTAINDVTALIETTSQPSGVSPYFIAITPDGTQTYTSNYSTNNVSAIDNASSAVSATITVRTGPHFMAITPLDGRRVLVSNSSGNSCVN